MPDLLPAKEAALLQSWMHTEGLRFLRHQQRVLALPEALISDFAQLQQALYLQYAGLGVGELIRDKLIPDQALALSTRLASAVTQTEVSYEQAIRFLQRQELELEVPRGWQVLTYATQPLGWINALPNRINNYYPKEWRIRSQQCGGAIEK